MKKVFIFLMAISAVAMGLGFMSFRNVEKSKRLFGIKIEFERGHKDWNGDKTATECVGKGICKLTITADALTTGGDNKGYGVAKNDGRGNLLIEIDRKITTQRSLSEMFEGAKFVVDGDFEIPNELIQKLGLKQNKVNKGRYLSSTSGDMTTVIF